MSTRERAKHKESTRSRVHRRRNKPVRKKDPHGRTRTAEKYN